jgi:WD40 repeat protein
LQHWIAEDLQGHQLRQHLAQVARQWEASERETSELYRGARLSATLDWSAAHGQDLNELEREFVQESRQAGEQENRRIRRTNRRLRGLLVGAAALLVVALIAGSVAFIQRGNARRSASAAEHSATVALSQSLGAKAIAEPRLDVAMLLAAQAVKLDDSVETQSDLLATLERSPWTTAIIPLEGEGTQAMKVAIGPDSKELAVTDDKGNLYFYDLATRQRIGEPLAGFAAYGDSDMVFTPDGSLLIAQNAAGTPKLIDRATHQVVKDFKRIRAGTQGLVLSPDGRIAYSGAEGSVARWDLVAQRRLPSVHISDTFNSIPVLASSTGEVITATHDRGGLVQVRDGTTLAVKRSFPVALPPDNFITVAVSPDGMVAAVCTNSGEDKSLTFVDLRTGALHKGTGGLSGGGFAFSPDGRTLVANSTISVSNNVIYVWDVASHTAVASLPGHEGAINDLKFDAAGHSVYATGADGTITVYDFTGAGRFGRPLSVGSGNPTDYPCCIPGFAYFSASPDGNTVATTQAAGIVNIVEVATGDTISSFQAIPDGYSVGTAYAPDGSVVAVTGEPGIVALWRLDEGQPRQVRTLRGLPQVRTVGLLGGAYHFTPTPLAVFSPDGRWVAATEGVQILDKGNPVGFRVTVAEWDASSGAQRAPSVEFPAESYSGNVVFSPDGRLVATAVDNDVLLLDATTLKVVRRFTSDPEGIAWLAFSPKGTYLATAGWSGDVHLWRVATWKQIGTGVRVVSGNLHNIEFDPTEQRVLITASGGLSGLWTVPNLRRIGGAELPHGPILSYSWSLSTFAGSSAVLVYANGEAYSWPAEVGGWVRRACEVAGRNLTQEEWRFYLQDRPYQKTCPDA